MIHLRVIRCRSDYVFSGWTANECLTWKGRKVDRRSQLINMSAKKFPTSANAAKKPKKKQTESQSKDAAEVDVNGNGVVAKCVTNADERETGHVTLKIVTNQNEDCHCHIVAMIENLPNPDCPEQVPVDPELRDDSDSSNDDASNHGDIDEGGAENESCNDDTSNHGDVDERSANKSCDAAASSKSVGLPVDNKPCNDDSNPCNDDSNTRNDDRNPCIDDTNDVIDETNRNTDESRESADTKASLSEDDDAAVAVDNAVMLISDDDDDDDVNDLHDNDDINLSVFDNLLWEVECTAAVWKLLKRFTKKGKRIFISKIQRLASGDRTHVLAKKLHLFPSDIQLYEAKLSSGARILWEPVVSQVIRVWHIVLQHDDLERFIARVVQSHKQGIVCQKFDTGSGVMNQRVEIDDDKGTENAETASPAVTKFYAFTSTLVSNILAKQGMKVDFPFLLTKSQNAIVDLQPPTAILLLGRSGTGKTTVCLCRLWSEFVRYWEKAGASRAPLFPWEMHYGQKEGSDSGERGEDASKPVLVENGARSVASFISETRGWDHLHQVFVTKNPVLCSEVQKNFCNLSHASAVASHHTAVELDDLPARMQDVRADAFPLFLTMRHLLLMLDGSMAAPFFEREPDGSLSREVAGWGDGNDQLSFIPDIFFDDDDVVLLENVAGDNPQNHESRRKKCDPRREVTYDVFVYELWPEMKKKLQVDCHATLVWMEIRSFIQGSFEALLSDTGYLTLEKYLNLGRKCAANFTSDRRAEIYVLYMEYCRLKQELAMYDENDLVYHVYRRLTTADGAAPDWVIHKFYVDETQDFTQAELCLLIRCSADPNTMFFTGDTAQSIMRGVAFRFEDLRSLFHYIKEKNKTSAIQVPCLYQLTHNHRSHAGILALAASIVDLMLRFFPNSFDRLEKDCGLFEGSKPVLLESCSVSDLALLLCGSQRHTSQIDFGAHQAILVANDQARDHIPEELGLGLVLTIFEAKGLEFDDILIYNFFKDSQVDYV